MHCWSKAGCCQTYGCEGKPVYHPAAETVQQPPQQSPSIAGDVPNYLVWAILATIFCCIPFGIVAIVYSSQVSGHLAAWRLNPLMILFLPAAVLFLFSQVKILFTGRSLPRFLLHPSLVWTIFGLILAFWIFRNIPLYPFTLLQPVIVN